MIKDVEGYEGLYQIDDYGNVWSLNWKNSGKAALRKPKVNEWGYATVNLKKNYQAKSFYIHRLVASAFLANPKNKRTVNHVNGIKLDNRLENLEWMTDSENHTHSYKYLGRRPHNAGKDACKRGHKYESGNFKIYNGSRHCSVCKHNNRVIKNGTGNLI